jgi:hypothetical protein
MKSKSLLSHLPDLLMVSGAGAVSGGAWLMFEPAGWIVGGLFAIVGGVLMSRGDQ